VHFIIVPISSLTRKNKLISGKRWTFLPSNIKQAIVGLVDQANADALPAGTFSNDAGMVAPMWANLPRRLGEGRWHDQIDCNNAWQ
jgi:hypothetical protein